MCLQYVFCLTERAETSCYSSNSCCRHSGVVLCSRIISNKMHFMAQLCKLRRLSGIVGHLSLFQYSGGICNYTSCNWVIHIYHKLFHFFNLHVFNKNKTLSLMLGVFLFLFFCGFYYWLWGTSANPHHELEGIGQESNPVPLAPEVTAFIAYIYAATEGVVWSLVNNCQYNKYINYMSVI